MIWAYFLENRLVQLSQNNATLFPVAVTSVIKYACNCNYSRLDEWKTNSAKNQ